LISRSASRALDNESITSFQALQAPFLIIDDPLAKAVATSDISAQMLIGQFKTSLQKEI